MVPIKNEKKRFKRKSIEHFYGSWSLKSKRVQGSEVLAMKIM